MITGSIASSLQGEPRATHDVDIVVNIQPHSAASIVNSFPSPRFYISEDSINEAIRRQSMFNLIDTTEGDKIDFWILTNNDFDLSRFARKQVEMIFNYTVKVSSPKDTILSKLRWAKLSGGSEKQFTDALRVYEVQFSKLNLVYINEWAGKLAVKELWQELQQKAEPM